MAKFGARILERMGELCKELEMIYGPDTGNLTVRIGAHSGPITGGYLRGKQSRFQLFGDTINVASRMESNGKPGKIQFSETTALLLMKGGGENWLEKRKQRVSVKGKGNMVTYWLSDAGYMACVARPGCHRSLTSKERLCLSTSESDRQARLVEWNTAELYKILQLIDNCEQVSEASSNPADAKQNYEQKPNTPPLIEVKEVLPLWDAKYALETRPKKKAKLNPIVKEQLRNFIQSVADAYPANEYHNFAHATHVVLSVIKYLNRIQTSSRFDDDSEQLPPQKAEVLFHERTFGIATDPLVQFTCAFTALIMDLNHPGKLFSGMKVGN